MKLAIFFILAACSLASSSPVSVEPINILRSDFDLQPEDVHKFGFETDNKIVREEVGELKNKKRERRVVKNEEGKDEQVIVIRGSYSYLDPEGHPITVTFFADETGFHAEGAHLPVALPPLSKLRLQISKEY